MLKKDLFKNSYLFIFGALGLRGCSWAFPRCGSGAPLGRSARSADSGCSCRPAQALRPVVLQELCCGRSCSEACGIVLDQRLNPCRLHWQADSHPLYNQGSPPNEIVLKEVIRISDTVFSIFLIRLTCELHFWSG